jgi:hypothetical protein
VHGRRVTTSRCIVAKRSRRRRLHYVAMRHELRTRRRPPEDQPSASLSYLWRTLDADEDSKLHPVDFAEVHDAVSHRAKVDDAVE